MNNLSENKTLGHIKLSEDVMKSGKILLIIKDENILKGLEKTLLNYLIDSVSDAERGLELCKVYRYTVIITDLSMETGNNPQIIKMIKTLNPDVAIIVLSDESNYHDTVTALNYGAMNFYTKPIVFEEIRNSVWEIFKMKAILDRTRKIDYYLISSKKIYEIPNDIGLISDLAATLSRDLIISEYCTEAEILNIDLALVEMITNSIEHGNLEISEEEKISLIENAEDNYLVELEKRSKSKPYCERIVRVEAAIDQEKVEFVIVDQGKGFDYSSIKEKLAKKDVMRINGRGILMTMAAMDEVIYEGKGNKVTLIKYFKKKN